MDSSNAGGRKWVNSGCIVTTEECLCWVIESGGCERNWEGKDDSKVVVLSNL